MGSETWKHKWENEVRPSWSAVVMWALKKTVFEGLLQWPGIRTVIRPIVNFMLRLNVFCANFLEESTIRDWRERERGIHTKPWWWWLLGLEVLIPWWHLTQGLFKLMIYRFDFDELEANELRPTTWNANMANAFANIASIGAAAATHANA